VELLLSEHLGTIEVCMKLRIVLTLNITSTFIQIIFCIAKYDVIFVLIPLFSFILLNSQKKYRLPFMQQQFCCMCALSDIPYHLSHLPNGFRVIEVPISQMTG